MFRGTAVFIADCSRWNPRRKFHRTGNRKRINAEFFVSGVVLLWLSYVALAAQAMTAALAAGRRSMDWAGVCMLGCITALGGGTIRDVLLGHYPLAWVDRPMLLAITAIA